MPIAFKFETETVFYQKYFLIFDYFFSIFEKKACILSKHKASFHNFYIQNLLTSWNIFMFACSEFWFSNANIKPFLLSEHTHTELRFCRSNTQPSILPCSSQLSHYIPSFPCSHPPCLALGLAHNRQKKHVEWKNKSWCLSQIYKMVSTASHLNKWTSVTYSHLAC